MSTNHKGWKKQRRGHTKYGYVFWKEGPFGGKPHDEECIRRTRYNFWLGTPGDKGVGPFDSFAAAEVAWILQFGN